MPRPLLDEAHVHPAIRDKLAGYQAELLREVQAAVAANDIVVIGMRQNPFPRKARRLLDAAGLPYRYLEYGSYVSQWRRRLALQLWTGWPTFPMVFVKGVLVGGAGELARLLERGELPGARQAQMRIWVDADACPAPVKEILYRAAERARLPLILVANKLLRTPPSPWIRALQVPRGFDVADNHIVRELQPGDLVITADIPLAADVIAKGGQALNPRGELYTPDTIRERLALRDFLDELRSSGVPTGGPAALGTADRKRFADQLDRLLARLGKA